MTSIFQPTELLRYSRQIILPEIGIQGQEILKKANVLVLGAGGLGCPVLQYLAGAGLGHIGIIDFDEIAMHNLHRQILYQESDIGSNKAEKAGEKIRQQNPHCKITIYTKRLGKDNGLSIIPNYDMVIDGCDNFETRYLVNDLCVKLGKPLVSGSIFGFQGQITLLNEQGSAHLRDLFPEPPPPGTSPDCGINGVLATLPGIMGTIMAQEAIMTLLGKPGLRNTLLCIDVLNWTFQKIHFYPS